MKWLSIEPLIGSIPGLRLLDIDWVVVDGESGSRGRPLRKDWIDDIRDLCNRAGVPFFFKQWGRLRNNPDPNDPTAKENGGTAKGGKRIDGRVCQEFPKSDVVQKKRRRLRDD